MVYPIVIALAAGGFVYLSHLLLRINLVAASVVITVALDIVYRPSLADFFLFVMFVGLGIILCGVLGGVVRAFCSNLRTGNES